MIVSNITTQDILDALEAAKKKREREASRRERAIEVFMNGGISELDALTLSLSGTRPISSREAKK